MQHLSGLGQAHATGKSLKQGNAKPIFEFPDFTRQGRLRNMQIPCCGTDASGFRNLVQHRQVMKIQSDSGHGQASINGGWACTLYCMASMPCMPRVKDAPLTLPEYRWFTPVDQ